MTWGDLVSADSKDRGEKFAASTRHAGGKALSKIGSRASESSDCLIKKQAIVLDMGEASREQGFRLNGCR